MPPTKFQEVIYAIFMSFFMVIAMEFYNTGLRMGGMTNACFLPAFHEMVFMVPICFIMGFCFMDKLAPKIAFKMVTPGKDLPLLVVVVRACVTVCLMCPVMSFWATLIFKQPGIEFIPVWMQTFVCNFPMALCWQVFFCGPLVRKLFRTVFAKQLAAEGA